jgi:hypothetical protein
MTTEANEETKVERFERQLNARFAFEAMVGAALVAAIAYVAVYFVFEVLGAVVDGAAIARLPAAAVGALTLGLTVFLGGFVGALVFGVPLFVILEKLKLRRSAHYVLGGVLANAVIFVLLIGRTPMWSELREVLFLTPGAAVAVLFLRRIAPLWKARPLRGEADTNIVRLH